MGQSHRRQTTPFQNCQNFGLNFDNMMPTVVRSFGTFRPAFFLFSRSASVSRNSHDDDDDVSGDVSGDVKVCWS